LSAREGESVNKTELIAAVAKDSGLARSDAAKAVDSMLTTVAKTLKRGDEVARVPQLMGI